MMHHRQSEQPGRMSAKVAHVDRNQQQPLRHQRRKQRDHAQVPDLPGVQSSEERRALRNDQCSQNAKCGYCTVRRDDECANVNEYGMHLGQHTAFPAAAAAPCY
jgi:hypothetical protein